MKRELGYAATAWVEFKIEAVGLIRDRGYGSSYGIVYC